MALAAAASDLQFGTAALVFVNMLLAAIMFGVGLDLDLHEFRRTIRVPKGPAVGLVTQFAALPALGFVVVTLVDPAPATALGILVVCSCPGGTVSNVITHLAGANVSLSIAMTTVSTFLALVMTPFNIGFWASRVESLSDAGVTVPLVELLVTLVLVIGAPVTVGVIVQTRRAPLAARLRRPMRVVAVTGLLLLVVGALAANASNIVPALRSVLAVVVVVNVLALALGYGAAALFRLPRTDRRAVSIEVGIQNTGLALTLTLAFFSAYTEAALVAAIWGMWHMTLGLTLARWWSGQPLLRPGRGS